MKGEKKYLKGEKRYLNYRYRRWEHEERYMAHKAFSSIAVIYNLCSKFENYSFD